MAKVTREPELREIKKILDNEEVEEYHSERKQKSRKVKSPAEMSNINMMKDLRKRYHFLYLEHSTTLQ